MIPSTTRVNRFDLSGLKSMLDIPDEVKVGMGRVMVATMCRRIWENSLTASGARLHPNSPGWQKRKQILGAQSIQPLVFTGDMTRVNAWKVVAANTAILASLSPEHWEKWDNIHDIADRTGRNWNEAFAFGELEILAGINFLHEYINSLR